MAPPLVPLPEALATPRLRALPRQATSAPMPLPGARTRTRERAAVQGGRLGKGLTSGAREEREGMTGGPNLAVRGKGLTGEVGVGLLCENRGRMDARVNFNWF